MAAVITKVEMFFHGEYTVTYESGARRHYKMDKLPKTAQAWLDEHKDVQDTINAGIEFWDKVDANIKALRDLKAEAENGTDLTIYAEYLKKQPKWFVISLATDLHFQLRGRSTKREALAFLFALNGDQAA